MIDSSRRDRRDHARLEQLLATTEDQLVAFTNRVNARKLVDPAKIGAAADRILRDSGLARCFTTTITADHLVWDHNQDGSTTNNDSSKAATSSPPRSRDAARTSYSGWFDSSAIGTLGAHHGSSPISARKYRTSRCTTTDGRPVRLTGGTRRCLGAALSVVRLRRGEELLPAQQLGRHVCSRRRSDRPQVATEPWIGEVTLGLLPRLIPRPLPLLRSGLESSRRSAMAITCRLPRLLPPPDTGAGIGTTGTPYLIIAPASMGSARPVM